MDDLVRLCDLIENSARGQIVELNVLFRHLNFDALFECVLARAVNPPSAEAVARVFHFLGVHTAVACAQSATDLTGFTRWYSRRLHSMLHIDTRPAAFETFHHQMGAVFGLPRSLVSQDAPRRLCDSAQRATRPSAVVHSERIGRVNTIRRSHRETSFSESSRVSRSPRSPRMTLTVQTSQSSGTGSERLSQYSNSPLAARSTSTGFVPSFRGGHLDPFPRISSTQVTPPPTETPLGSDLDDDLPESISSKLVESPLNSGKPPLRFRPEICRLGLGFKLCRNVTPSMRLP